MNRRDFLNKLGYFGLGASSTLAFRQADANLTSGEQEIYMPIVRNGAASATSLLVAAVDAPSELRAIAHYLCDGTDDQLEINQAISDLGTIGGLVQLTEGTFSTSGAIRLNRRITLQGKGCSTLLQATGTWTAHDGTSPGAVIEPSGDDIDKTYVTRLAIDGRRYTGADVKGIYYNITDNAGFDEGPDAANYFADIYIFETRQHGFHLAGSRNRACNVSRVRVYNVGEEGVTEAHGLYIQCPDGFYSQCESGSSSGSGFYVDHSNNRFTNCKSWFSDLSGWQIRKPRNQFSACESQDNEQHGYYISTGPNVLTGCHADSNSWNSASPVADYDGFHIPWGQHIQLVGCAAYDKDEAGRGNWQRYGFYMDSAAEFCQVIGVTEDNAMGTIGGAGASNSSNLVLVNG